ncbi:hypothetical protein FOFC_05405 [Fusarium oxysporum]|nr:hypothetical protein FOFC_05405 [Fusarium oxysporum]
MPGNVCSPPHTLVSWRSGVLVEEGERLLRQANWVSSIAQSKLAKYAKL